MSRITSILKTNCLDTSITNLPTFNLTELNLNSEPQIQLPVNLRLGHLVEKIVSEFIKLSSNYKVLYENTQVIENKKTIGEIDFIIEEIKTKQVIHMELAYKFYLFDPNISSDPINNWIGPNRNDSLKEKLEKLKRKQFPLLYHKCTKEIFNTVKIEETKQALCLLTSLFIPYNYKIDFSPSYEKAIQGYYLNQKTFSALHNSEKTYFLPAKKEWGIEPSKNESWLTFNAIETLVNTCMNEKQAPLCWQKEKDSYVSFFIVWW